MTLLQKIIYVYLNTLARVVFRIYFKRITIKGKETIPKNTPTLVSPNHPNTMIDPVLMASIMPGWIHFLANYGLFKHPVSKFLMSKIFFSIPVKRPKDVAPGETVNNLSTIKMCSKILGNGSTIFMGPEATSYAYRRIRPLKDGIARIALTAAKSQKFKSNLIILPLGTNYSDPTKFRSEIILQVGEPIYLDNFKDDYKKDKSATSEKVMDLLRTKLESLSIHTEDEIENQFLMWLESLGKSENIFQSFEEQLFFDQAKIPLIRTIRKENPLLFQETWSLLYQYFHTLSNISVEDSHVKNKEEFSLKSQFSKTVTYPLLLIARIINFQWFLPQSLFNRLKLYRGYSSMIKILGGIILIPLITIFLFSFISMIGSFQLGYIYLLISVIFGLFILPLKKIRHHLICQKNILQTPDYESISQQREFLLLKLKDLGLL